MWLAEAQNIRNLSVIKRWITCFVQAHFSTVVTLACCLVLALLLVSVILVVTVRLLRGAGQ